jgi:hypothetical protein
MSSLPRLPLASLAFAAFVASSTLPALSADDPIAVCFGSDTDCPCSNGGDGSGGCDNNEATGGAKIEVTTFSDSAPQVALVRGSRFPMTEHLATLLFRSSGAVASPTPFGDGLLCTTTTGVVRLGSSYARGGIAGYVVRHGAGPGTFSYQVVYRDHPASFCTAAAFNTTNGIVIAWP